MAQQEDNAAPAYDLTNPEGKRVMVIESTRDNGGVRSRLLISLGPHETVPPHNHPHYTETLKHFSGGSISVYTGPSVHEYPSTKAIPSSTLAATATLSEAGQSIAAPPGLDHRYIVGPEAVVLEVTCEPGWPGFEHVPDLLEGVREDGFIGLGPDSKGNDVSAELGGRLLESAVMELTGTAVVGVDGDELRAFRAAEASLVARSMALWSERYLDGHGY